MIPFHPLANLFPLIEGKEFDELVADVKVNGLRERIVILDGKILDGRNRYRAARDARILRPDEESLWLRNGYDQTDSGHTVDHVSTLHFERFHKSFGDPLAWALSKNLHRRHLSDNQRTMIAAEIATMRQGRPSEWDKNRDDKPANRPDSSLSLSQDEAAELLHVSERNVRRGRAVLDHGAPELVEAVKADRIAVSAAAEVAKLTPSEQLEIIRSMPPHLVARAAKERVGNGGRSVNAGRVEPSDSLDFFPTPPWATRALMDTVLADIADEFAAQTVWEPACGEGHISGVLEEYFGTVLATDIFDYSRDGRAAPGWRGVLDFLGTDSTVDNLAESEEPDWIITNPPFSGDEDRALAFALRAIRHARRGVAIFVRTQWLEGVGRYRDLFKPNTPTVVAQFVERVPLHRGRWEPDGDTAAQYCWLVWIKGELGPCGFYWIPPGQRALCADDRDGERFTARPVLATPEELKITQRGESGTAREASGGKRTSEEEMRGLKEGAQPAPRHTFPVSSTDGEADAPPGAAAEGEGDVGEGSGLDQPPVGAGDALPRARRVTREEAEPILRERYATTDVRVLSEEFGGVPINTIRSWAFKLGLTDVSRRAQQLADRNRARGKSSQEPNHAA